MRELVEPVGRLRAEGTPAVLVRAVEVVGFGAGQYDNALVATADGLVGGAVLRGVSDAAVRAAVQEVLSDPARRTRLVPVSIDDPDAAAGGLSCGGTAQLVVGPLEAVPAALWSQLAEGHSVVLATVLDDDAEPVTLVVGPDGPGGSDDPGWSGTDEIDPNRPGGPGSSTPDGPDTSGADEVDPNRPGGPGSSAPDGPDTSAAGADQRVTDAARALLDDPRALRATVELDRGRALLDKVVPRTQVVAVGGGEVVDALADVGRALGWLVDPRADGPDAVAAAGSLSPADALVVTSHHPRWGPDTLAAGLHSRSFFVGALGSRRTQERRAEALAERGVGAEALARIHGPVGLDLGGRTPAETALAICAEILAVRAGRDLPSLRDRSGPINA